jgi:hypothetical protein
VFQGIGLTIRNNTLRAEYSRGAGMYGLAYLNAGSLNLSRSLISDNLALAEEEARGAGMYLATPSVILGDVTVRGNPMHFLDEGRTYVYGTGGGIYATDACKRGSLTDVVVESHWVNATVGGVESCYLGGAGMMWAGQTSLQMTRCIIRNNGIDVLTRPNG